MLPTLPAQDLSLLRCHPAAAGSLLPWQLPAWHSTGSRPRRPGKIPNLCFGFLLLLAAPGRPSAHVPQARSAEVPHCSRCPLPQACSFFCMCYEDPCWATSSPKEGVLRIGCQSRVNGRVGPNPVWHRLQEMLSLSGSWEPEAPLPFPSWTLVTLSPPTPGNVQKLHPWSQREGLWGRLTEAVAGRAWCFLHNGSTSAAVAAFARMCLANQGAHLYRFFLAWRCPFWQPCSPRPASSCQCDHPRELILLPGALSLDGEGWSGGISWQGKPKPAWTWDSLRISLRCLSPGLWSSSLWNPVSRSRDRYKGTMLTPFCCCVTPSDMLNSSGS